MNLLSLGWKSAARRRASLLLAALSIAISVCLILSIDNVRQQVKDGFMNTVSGTDIIAGARGGSLNLLLYSVFHIGDATSNLSRQAYEKVAALPEVDWALPLVLGDSHKGYRVVGSSAAFFTHFHYGRNQALAFREGGPFTEPRTAVLGAEVARTLGYQSGDEIILTHGLVAAGFADHAADPFRVTGILQATGTPIDRAVLVPVAGLDAIHGVMPGSDISVSGVTAVLIGLKNRVMTFRLQRQLNEEISEPMTAIIPGATLAELWRLLGRGEKILFGVAALVFLAALAGVVTTLLATLNERRREMALLRAVGAKARHVLVLYVFESAWVSMLGALIGVVLYYAAQWLFAPWLTQQFGVLVEIRGLSAGQWLILAGVVGAGLLSGLVPGWLAYRRSLQDGLQIKY
ncbi:ABC transporter permease [Granulosicoccaceae sp. 1_MG-2023]|nr:ABC transporter permease [Granulosicoccaceae sp. 1_MG-2023]